MQLFQDRICSSRPLEGLAVGIVVSDKLVDALNQLLYAGERSATDCFVSDQRKESLDLVQPRAVGRDEVHVPTGPGGQPGLTHKSVI